MNGLSEPVGLPVILVIRDISADVTSFDAAAAALSPLELFSDERKNGAFSGAFGGSLGLLRC